MSAKSVSVQEKKAKVVAGMVTGQKVSVMNYENVTKDHHGDDGDRKASGH